MTRLLDHLLFTSLAASANPANQPLQEGIAPCDGVTVQTIAGAGDAHTWNLEQRATLVAAVEVAATHPGYRHAWRLAATISRFLYTQGHADDMRRVLESAHASLTAGTDRFARAHILSLLGLAYISARKLDDARARLLEAVDLFRALGDHAGQALACQYLDYLCDHQGMNEEGLAYARKALEHYSAAGDHTGQAYMLNAMGDALAKLGRLSDAAAHSEQALAIFQSAGNHIGEAAAYERPANGSTRPTAFTGSETVMPKQASRPRPRQTGSERIPS
jgi:tetratricopeptide (TPR) repeat protein